MSDYGSLERRNKCRLYADLPTKVRGKDADGRPFEFDTQLDNLSASGLYLHLPVNLAPGARLSMVIDFLGAVKMHVAISGHVVRAESLASGDTGLAVVIENHRFL